MFVAKCVCYILMVSHLNAQKLEQSQTISILSQLISEQAHWRHWRQVLLVGDIASDAAVVKSLSRSMLLTGHTTENKTNCYNYGYVCADIPKYTKQRCSITTTDGPWLIITEKKNENFWKQQLEYSKNVQYDSDILIAAYDELGNGESTVNITTLQQVYKIHEGAKLSVNDYGFWAPNYEFPALTPTDNRTGTQDFKIKLGVKNETDVDNGSKDPNQHLTAIVEREENKHIEEIVKCLLNSMNMSYESVEFPRRGWKNEEGAWTYLMGAVVDGQVDMALDTVVVTQDDVGKAVFLANPVVKSMHGVYYKRSGSVQARDVYSSTFSFSLQISVLGTIATLWIGMLLILSLSADATIEKAQAMSQPSEAGIWVAGVICMQGSQWSPRSASGCLLLISSLMFALIINNAFAAFITSFLSVRTNSVKSVGDLLKRGYSFGFTKGSSDELFLRNTDDKNLLALYYNGLVTSGGVADVTEGILKSVSNEFGFYADARLARRNIGMAVPKIHQCKIEELLVRTTITSSAIPISKTSPYRKAFQYWQLRIWESGILRHIAGRLLPSMPNCYWRQTFSGAQYSDLMMAYYFYAGGLVASFIILWAEILWARRGRRLQSTVNPFSTSLYNAQKPFLVKKPGRWGLYDLVN